jgi:hypothetical protein
LVFLLKIDECPTIEFLVYFDSCSILLCTGVKWIDRCRDTNMNKTQIKCAGMVKVTKITRDERLV